MDKIKYYIADISEFHVGFEYESYNEYRDEWVKSIITYEDYEKLGSFWYNFLELYESGYLRVKYLDQEDIESLGFEKCKNGSFVKNSNPRYCQWTITQWDNYRISIKFYHPDDSLGEIWFRGTIKNKSELKKVLTMLGI